MDSGTKENLSGDAKYYLGGVSQSLEHLPQWYQILSLMGVLVVVFLRHNSVINLMAVTLHSSLGTSGIWYEKYQRLLENMTFNERFCFALYGLALGITGFVLYRVFCQERHRIGWPASQLFPDKKAPTIVLGILLCVREGLYVKSANIEALSEKNSLANLALNHFQGIEQTSFDPELAQSNVHFVIQMELLKMLLYRFLFYQGPLFVVAALFRFSRDVIRKEHVGLRWYMATTCYVSIIRECAFLYTVYLSYVYERQTQYAKQTATIDPVWLQEHESKTIVSLCTITWSLLFLGTVNFIYGPSKRAGVVVTASAINCFHTAAKGMLTCYALTAIATLVVLTAVVSVHVVELIGMWLVMFLLLVWVPAIIDSCSTDYMAILSVIFACGAKALGSVTSIMSASRFAILFFFFWLNISLVYNLMVNLLRRRLPCVFFIVWVVLFFLNPSEEERSYYTSLGVTNGLFTYAARMRLVNLCNLADFHETQSSRWLPHLTEDGVVVAFWKFLRFNIMFTLIAMAPLYFLHASQSVETRQSLHRQHIPIVTPVVLFRKLAHSLVLYFIIGVSFGSGWLFLTYFSPRISVLPGIFWRCGSGGVCCIVLGMMMDLKKPMYDCILRLFAQADPPKAEDEQETEDDETKDETVRRSLFDD